MRAGNKVIAVAIGMAVFGISASRADQPDLLALAQHEGDACVAELPRSLAPCLEPATAGPTFGDVIINLSITPGTGDENPTRARGTVAASASPR